MPTLIPQSQQRLMRWKNGGGVTCEIMRHPEYSSLDSFDWRISVATVQQGGAFSQFPGIDRSLAILAGAGVQLELNGRSHTLRPRDAALRFDGDIPVQASLLEGAVVDFNVMTRRTRYQHTLQAMTLHTASEISLDADQHTLLYVIRGSCTLSGGMTLHSGDAAWFEAAQETCLATPAGAAAELMLVYLQAASA